MIGEKIKFSDVAHLYKDCTIVHSDFRATVQWVMRYGVCADYNIDNQRFKADFDKIKPLLIPINKLPITDFADICKVIFMNDKVIFSVVNNYYAVTVDDDDDTDDMDEDYRNNFNQRIINAESNDYDNVLSISYPSGEYAQLDLAHGTDGEMRYFVDVKTQAIFINELCKRGYDVFGLIKSGEAIEFTELEK
jgi:hypothetical protein